MTNMRYALSLLFQYRYPCHHVHHIVITMVIICSNHDYSCRSGRGRKAEKRRDFRHYQVYPHISSIHGKYLSFCLLCISDCVKIFSEPSKYISVYTVGFVQRAILAISISWYQQDSDLTLVLGYSDLHYTWICNNFFLQGWPPYLFITNNLDEQSLSKDRQRQATVLRTRYILTKTKHASEQHVILPSLGSLLFSDLFMGGRTKFWKTSEI